MTYEPREFWEDRLERQFDVRGTGETELPLSYNLACYTMRREVLDRALHEAGIALDGAAVADIGCGTGFFTEYYLRRGARVTGYDIASVSIARLSQRFPQARFVLGDVSDRPLDSDYDLVNAFDVLYHITDEVKWERAVTHLADAVKPRGWLAFTDRFTTFDTIAAHNVARPLETYRRILEPRGLRIEALRETHFLLNRDLGLFRSLNRFPALLLAIDRAVLARRRRPEGSRANTLLLARRS